MKHIPVKGKQVKLEANNCHEVQNRLKTAYNNGASECHITINVK